MDFIPSALMGLRGVNKILVGKKLGAGRLKTRGFKPYGGGYGAAYGGVGA